MKAGILLLMHESYFKKNILRFLKTVNEKKNGKIVYLILNNVISLYSFSNACTHSVSMIFMSTSFNLFRFLNQKATKLYFFLDSF